MKLGVVAMASACVLLSACASVTRGSSDAWEINSDPGGARVETTNGFTCEATPCAIRMKRKSQFVATLTKPGFKPATISVTHKTAKAGAVGMAGNALVGGLIGVVIDSSTGATQDLTPNPALVKLEPVGLYDPVGETVPLPPPQPILPPASAPSSWSAPPPPPTNIPAQPGIGGNVIKGAAFLRTRNGQTRSCAGFPVRLLPRGPSTIAFVRETYGSEMGGFVRRTVWEPQPFDAAAMVETCDAQGGFIFQRLPDGDYYVSAVVSIETPAVDGRYVVQEGGTLVSLVSVAGGVVKPVVLTQ